MKEESYRINEKKERRTLVLTDILLAMWGNKDYISWGTFVINNQANLMINEMMATFWHTFVCTDVNAIVKITVHLYHCAHQLMYIQIELQRFM